MRLDEWQKYIDSEFVADGKSKREKHEEKEKEQDLEPDSQSLSSDDTGISSRETEPTAKDQENHLPRVQSKAALQAPPDAIALDRMAVVNPEMDSIILSFDRYLPPSHPASLSAQEPAVQEPTMIPDASSQTSAEQEPGIPRQDGIAAPYTREPETSSSHTRDELSEEGHGRIEVPPTVQRQDLLSSLAALGRLYDSMTQSVPEAPDESHKSKRELLERLINPVLTMDEAAQLLGVSPTSIRRYTNRGMLPCFRQGEEKAGITRAPGRDSRHRRFWLSDILRFLETRQATLQADGAKEQAQKAKGRTWLV